MKGTVGLELETDRDVDPELRRRQGGYGRGGRQRCRGSRRRGVGFDLDPGIGRGGGLGGGAVVGYRQLEATFAVGGTGQLGFGHHHAVGVAEGREDAPRRLAMRQPADVIARGHVERAAGLVDQRRAAAAVYPVALPWSDVADADKRAIAERAGMRARAADPAIDAVTGDFERFEFYRFFQALQNFCVVDLSNVYLDIAKDRLTLCTVHSAKGLEFGHVYLVETHARAGGSDDFGLDLDNIELLGTVIDQHTGRMLRRMSADGRVIASRGTHAAGLVVAYLGLLAALHGFTSDEMFEARLLLEVGVAGLAKGYRVDRAAPGTRAASFGRLDSASVPG